MTDPAEVAEVAGTVAGWWPGAAVFGVAAAVVRLLTRAHRDAEGSYELTRANLQAELQRLVDRNDKLSVELDEALSRERVLVDLNRGLEAKVDDLERHVRRQDGEIADLADAVATLRIELADRAGDDGRRAP